MIIHKVSVKKIIRRFEAYAEYFKIWIRWIVSAHNLYGITNKNYGHPLIISLTSYPGRIKYVKSSIRSLLLQKLKPNHLILWLCQEEFPQKEKQLPKELIELTQKGLEIKWCQQYYSYKKIIPTIKEFPNAIIVTADDDLVYRSDWLESLYNSYLTDPNYIYAHRVTKFYFEDEYKTIVGGYERWNCACFLNKLTSGAGALFPPGTLYQDVCADEIFLKLCRTNDDIWLWIMGVLQGTRVVPVRDEKQLNLIYVIGSQKGESLSKINDFGENRFWKDFYMMLDYYKQLDNIFLDEYKRVIDESGIES